MGAGDLLPDLGPQRARAARGRCRGARPTWRPGGERARPGGRELFSSRSRRPLPPRTARRPLFLRGGNRISPRLCDASRPGGARPGPGPCAPGAAPARGCARKARRGARCGRARARRAGRPVRRPSAGARRGRRGPPSFLPGRGSAGPPRPDPYGLPDLRAAKSQRQTPGPRVSARRGGWGIEAQGLAASSLQPHQLHGQGGGAQSTQKPSQQEGVGEKDFVGRGRCDCSSPALTWAETESLVPVSSPAR
ncbi:translation initiation factor IF-2 [Bubalus bubalis]|uniref:translation initiation factor IF-2 n=1 Tax=Bubalus bubalis TaxID=89462 RepID=UPI001E1B788B|nr:translation initiation factor IF-2 [Bubalus bubalis]